MIRSRSLFLFIVSCALIPGGAAFAQSSISPQPPQAATAQSAVPALISYSGAALDVDGRPLAGETSITFLIFKEEQGGEPLWAETQSVGLSATGHYKVDLGATNSSGLPQALFSTGEARWLEAQVAGRQPQQRVRLASVPYSMEAADAATLGGLPASAFLRADDLKSAAAALQSSAPLAMTISNTVTTTGGAPGFVPTFTGVSTIANSEILDTGTSVGIGDQPNPAAKLDVNGETILRGVTQVSRTANASTSAGANSYGLDLYTQAYDSATKTTVSPYFQWQGEVFGNNSAAPGATMNVLYTPNGTAPVETGLYFNGNGTIHFAPGQTFPGTGNGNGTITGVAAGTGLTGGGTAGAVSLAVNEGVVAFQSDLANAEKTLNAGIAAAQSAAVVTAEAYAKGTFLPLSGGAVNGPVTFTSPDSFAQGSGNSFAVQAANGTVNTSASGLGISLSAGAGSTAFNGGAYGGNGGSINLTSGAGGDAENGALGNAGDIVLTLGAPGSVVDSFQALVGHVLVIGDDTNVERGTPSQLQIRGASNNNKQLLIGYYADSGSDNGYGAIQATNTGVVNTPLVLNANGGGVGIQTTNVTNSLTIGQGQGPALADGWNIYSSRRFKTDIATLTGSLEKVERMRGVSYTLTATGKREIGVIAEEVGAVVPEAVAYEKNGVDAQSVDYNRLTAVLIEATKEQQAEIARQGEELKAAIRQVHLQQAQLRKAAAAVKTLEDEVRSGNASLQQVKKQLVAQAGVQVASR